MWKVLSGRGRTYAHLDRYDMLVYRFISCKGIGGGGGLGRDECDIGGAQMIY